ncbi:MAG: hypothetical protein IJW19_06095 [Clostridia bacterium]|nr:hypothetical protein [Clostridia bacterium]
MIELKKCCKVPFPEKLFEEYEEKENAIYANVNASKVPDMMKNFIKSHNEPLFFILELPCKMEDSLTESKLLYNINDNDIYYIDGLNDDEACQCIDALSGFLIKDGLNTFGIGGHTSHEEILFGKYNVMTIYTQHTEKYHNFLNSFNIKKTDSLLTAWDTFDKEHPGECWKHISEQTGKTVYDIPDMYEDFGMYLYEARKEYNEAYEKQITYEELLGKLLLVGITYFTKDNELIEQKQFYGVVTEANDSFIRIKQPNGTELTLPPDLSSTKRARPGEYKLCSTGEAVVNPDFHATWNLIKGD